jgi:hexosaminidase
MIVSTKKFCFALIAAALSTALFTVATRHVYADVPNPQPVVIPALQSWAGGQGVTSLKRAVIVVPDSLSASLEPEADAFQNDLQLMGFGSPKIVHSIPSRGAYYLLKTGSMPVLEKSAVVDQAYTIQIGGSNVVVTGGNSIGVYYGTRTILQMLAAAGKAPSLPNGSIVDYPKYRRRMLLLDAGRKPFPYPALLDYLRMMGWFKFNELHLHLSDEATTYAGFRVQCDTYPGLTSTDCFYTKKQLRQLQDIAHTYGITITPEIDMPGHSLAFTNYWPGLRNPNLNPYYMDVTNPQTVVRMKKLLDEVIPLFDAPDFHIGTDEYSVGGSPEDQLKFQEAFRVFINTMAAYVRSKGKNCRIWSGYEHMLGDTPIDSDITIDMWESNDAQAEMAQGHNIINSDQGVTYIVPGAHYYGVNNASVYNNWEPWKMNSDPSKNPDPNDPRFLGSKLHVWMDKGPDGYDMTEVAALTQPSLMAFGEKMWGTKGFADYSKFAQQTAYLYNVPGVTIFDRIPAKSKDGIVLSAAGEHDLTQKSTVPLAFYGKPRTDLEWPWTLSMHVMKTADTQDRGVIISSNNMEVCADYARTVAQQIKDPVTGVISTIQVPKRGIGLDRAFGAPGADPSLSSMVNDAAGVYADPLILGKWTTLTLVGTAGMTTLYINGLFAGQQNNQMLCPLAMLGSPSGHSFTGKIKDVVAYDRALSKQEIAHLAGFELPPDLAAGRTVTASASDTPYGLTPDKITDGDMNSRWSSGITSAPQWVIIDLGAVRSFNELDVTWESAYPGQYTISVSNDKSSWTQVFSGAGKVGPTDADFPEAAGRYVKIDMNSPATGWGYSIFDAEVVNQAAPPQAH